jgi:hypothetical protein
VKMMKPHQPFKFAEDKRLISKPICWTTKALKLSKKLKIPIEKIEEIQQTLLYKSLINSAPVRPDFLEEYDLELTLTAAYLRDREKIPLCKDEEKDGFSYFTAKIKADQIKEDKK